MQIISGIYKGRSLNYDSKHIRPTTSKVRAAFFNSIAHEITEARFLELFCGSAAMSIEALSRGARQAIAVDLHIDIAVSNLKKLAVENLEIYKNDALRALSILSKKEPFDIVYIDPPYAFKNKKDLLFSLGKFAILNSEGLLAIESDELEPEIEGLDKIRVKDYGQTKITFYQKQCKK